MLDFDFNQVKNNRRQNLGFNFIEELKSLSDPASVKISDDEIRFVSPYRTAFRYTDLMTFTNGGNIKKFLDSNLIRYFKNYFNIYCKPYCPFFLYNPDGCRIRLNLIKIAKMIDHCYLTISARETPSESLIEASKGKVLIYHHYGQNNSVKKNHPILAKSKVYYIGYSLHYDERKKFNINNTLKRLIYNEELKGCQIDCEKLIIRIKDEYIKSNNLLISLIESLLDAGIFINPNMRIGFCSHGSSFPKFLQEYFPNSFFFTFPENDDEFFDYEDIKNI